MKQWRAVTWTSSLFVFTKKNICSFWFRKISIVKQYLYSEETLRISLVKRLTFQCRWSFTTDTMKDGRSFQVWKVETNAKQLKSVFFSTRVDQSGVLEICRKIGISPDLYEHFSEFMVWVSHSEWYRIKRHVHFVILVILSVGKAGLSKSPLSYHSWSQNTKKAMAEAIRGSCYCSYVHLSQFLVMTDTGM